MKFLTATLILCALTVSVAGQSRRKPGLSKYIDALVSAPKLLTYTTDGAADVSVISADPLTPNADPIPEVRDIVRLGSKAIPLLISHLDDTRLTAARFDPDKRLPVPVGYICLDILTGIIHAPRIVTEECETDGIDACIAPGYFFRPDAYGRKGDKYIASRKVHQVKLKWQRAYRKGHIKYQYPQLWKRRI